MVIDAEATPAPTEPLFPGIARLTTLHMIPTVTIEEERKGGLPTLSTAATAQIAKIKLEIPNPSRDVDIALCGASRAIDLTLSATGLNRDGIPKGLCRGLSVVGFKAKYGHDALIDKIARLAGESARNIISDDVNEQYVMDVGEKLLHDIDAMLVQCELPEKNATAVIVAETAIINLLHIALPASYCKQFILVTDGEANTIHMNRA